jgi:hypothetical protein
LWKAEGHNVPGDLDKLVSLLVRLRAPIGLEYRSLSKDYEEYVRFCESISIASEDIQSPMSRDETSPRALHGVVEETQYGDVLKKVRVTFSDIERLRSLQRTMKDMDGLIDLLAKIQERFSSLTKQKGQDLRLFISSTGKGLSFRLVFGHGAAELTKQPARIQEVNFDNFDVEGWMEYGMKAILAKGSETEIES